MVGSSSCPATVVAHHGAGLVGRLAMARISSIISARLLLVGIVRSMLVEASKSSKGVGGVDGSHGEIWENWVETWLKVRNSQSTTSETFVLSFGGNAECIPMQCAYPQAITGCSFPL